MSDYTHGEPPEGHCCLCTMEDITKEDNNYGKHVNSLDEYCIVTNNAIEKR